MRLRKSDPTGSYWYDADGVSPASDVLSDGHTTFTPGTSEINGNGSRFYLPDAQGNSRGLLDGGQGNPDGYNWDAFGNSVSRGVGGVKPDGLRVERGERLPERRGQRLEASGAPLLRQPPGAVLVSELGGGRRELVCLLRQ